LENAMQRLGAVLAMLLLSGCMSVSDMA